MTSTGGSCGVGSGSCAGTDELTRRTTRTASDAVIVTRAADSPLRFPVSPGNAVNAIRLVRDPLLVGPLVDLLSRRQRLTRGRWRVGRMDRRPAPCSRARRIQQRRRVHDERGGDHDPGRAEVARDAAVPAEAVLVEGRPARRPAPRARSQRTLVSCRSASPVGNERLCARDVGPVKAAVDSDAVDASPLFADYSLAVRAENTGRARTDAFIGSGAHGRADDDA